MVTRLGVLALALALAACGGDDGAPAAGASGDGADDGTSDAETTGAPSEPSDPLAPAALLRRASLDLRGVGPTADELDAIAADPSALDDMIAAFVDDDRFGLRVRDIFAAAWRTRVDLYPDPSGLESYDLDAPSHDAIGEEPLNLVAYVAMNERPFTEILRGDITIVDPLLLAGWPLATIDAGGDWLPPDTVLARYTDGRPPAGVLALDSVYWRHSSTVENANRGRANALSQALLCQSYLDRPIDFPTDLDLTDSESIRDAIHHNDACQACHSTLDPFASYLWGFMYPTDPLPTYSFAGEHDWQINTGTPPGFFGIPGQRLQDLGEQVAADERFVACTVRRMYEGLLGRKAELDDEGALAEHREAFLAADLSIKALARSIVGDPSYRGVAHVPRFGGAPAPVVLKVAPVEVLARSLAELSGYQLRYGGREATRLDAYVRRLAGGSDRGSATGVSTGAVLVQRRLAEAGAMFLVDAARAGDTTGGRLDAVLGDVDLEAAPARADIVALVELARGVTLAEDDPELVALAGLWDDAARVSDPEQAWIALVTAILADPDHILY